jgi:hypothetical protein
MPVRNYWFCFRSTGAGRIASDKGVVQDRNSIRGHLSVYRLREMSTEQASTFPFPLFSLNHGSVKMFL